MVSGHRMIDVIPGDDQLPVSGDTSVPGAPLLGRRTFPSLPFLPFPSVGSCDRMLRARDDASPLAA
jgi:hypothetical protein